MSAQGQGPAERQMRDMVALYSAGRYAEAAALARELTARFPGHPLGWKALGAAYKEMGRPEEALQPMQMAVALMPGDAEAHCNLGHALVNLGRLEEAAQSYRRALQIAPGYFPAQADLANALKNLGRAAEAEAGFRRALEIRPDAPEMHNNLAVLLQDLGRHEEAAAECGRALELAPRLAQAHNNLGISLIALNRLEEAQASLRRALELQPHYAAAHCNLGVALQGQGRFEEAEQSYARAVGIQPDYALAHSNRGFILQELGRLEEAEASCRRALEVAPDFAEAHNNLGLVLQATGHLVQAEASLRRALEIKPRYAGAISNLGNVQKDQGRLEAAEASYRRAIALKADFTEAHSNLGSALNDLGRFDEALQSHRRPVELRSDLAWAYSNLLFLLGQQGRATPAEYLEQARGYESALPAGLREQARNRTFLRAARAGRRLRIGYVSGDLRAHAVSYFFEPILRSHDKSRVEIFLYQTSPKRDAVTERLERHAEHWVSLVRVSDDAALERLLADGIDVLVDLSGHTAHNRLRLFARRAAPVQCHYVGYFASTGLSEMDYFIGDEVLIPPAHETHFSEKIWRLPRTFSSYAAPEEAPEPGWESQADGRLCVGSFNNLAKITERTIELWAKVLKRLPQACLLLKTGLLEEPLNRERIHARLESLGIPRSRVELRGATKDWREHMALYGSLAVSLDPVGAMTGATTTSDALWMGVPVVTLEGDRMSGRLGSTMVTAIGHEEWRARSEEDYVEIVARLVGDEAKRKELRSTLRETMRTSPLCDAAGLARALEDAYEAMFDRWWAQRKKG